MPMTTRLALRLRSTYLGISWPTVYEPRRGQAADGIVKMLGINRWPTLLLFDGERKLIAASPYLNMSTISEDSAGAAYGVDSLDWTLTKVLEYAAPLTISNTAPMPTIGRQFVGASVEPLVAT